MPCQSVLFEPGLNWLSVGASDDMDRPSEDKREEHHLEDDEGNLSYIYPIGEIYRFNIFLFSTSLHRLYMCQWPLDILSLPGRRFNFLHRL